MIRCLNFSEIQSIYDAQIKLDFPRMERRPLFIIRNLYRQGRYVCLVLEENDQILAYATFLCDETINNVLLDYYAVDKKHRGNGIGSQFLSMLREYWRDKSGILLECERPDFSKSKEEENIRKRRIEFYLRGGAERTPLHWQLFGVDYNILWLPTKRLSVQVNIAGDLTGLYACSMPSIFRLLFTQIKTEGS